MAQDIEMFKNDLSIPDEGLKRGHEARFNALWIRTSEEAKAKAEGYLWMKIAAVLVVWWN